MAKARILVNKLIMTFRGEDFVLNNILGPDVPPTKITQWEQGFDLNNYKNYSQSYNYGITAESQAKYNLIKAITESGNLDIKYYCMNMGNAEELYFWREEVGRNVRLVVRRSGTQCQIYTYLYGTYTQFQGFPNRDLDWAGNEGFPYTIKLGFGLDDSTNKYILYIQNGGPYDTRMPPDGSAMSNVDGVVFGYINLSSTLAILLTGNTPAPPPTPSSDPYADGGYSTGTDTGTGTFDDTSDAIADPSTPTLSPSIGNFVNQYVVSANALSNFGTWLYSGGNIFDNLAKVFQSPMEAIINVGILPYKPTFDPNAYVDIKVGGLNSNVQARLITNNYEVVDMGTIDFDPFYGSALDYNPYTKCYIYLPYCGTFPLNVDEIMGHKISLKYYCDSLSGDCVAVISDEERVLEQFRGNTFIQVPITARDFSSIYTNALNSAISLAAGIATVAATGGVSAPVAVGMGTSMASNAMNSKTHYSRSGGFSGIAGFMSVQKPYVILTIPRQCLPDKQNEFQGYPLFVTKTLSDCSGFTKVYEIHLDGLDCTDAEAKEIYELLKGGVVL